MGELEAVCGGGESEADLRRMLEDIVADVEPERDTAPATVALDSLWTAPSVPEVGGAARPERLTGEVEWGVAGLLDCLAEGLDERRGGAGA